MLEGIEGLIERVLPAHYAQIFRIEFMLTENGNSVWELEGDGGRIIVRGDSPVSQAAALGHYIKYFCKINLSWCGKNNDFPQIPPIPEGRVHKVILQKNRVYMNYCTFAYSAAFWNWERWEQEIDFMALNGINMPLSIVGTEAVWFYTLLKHKFNERDALEAISGPAFWPWQLMGNIEGHLAVTDRSYIDSRLKLGKQIIAREAELGMTPIQQGFSGFAPRKIKDKYPLAKIHEVKGWCGFADTVNIDPLDPLFYEMGISFLTAQKEIFGTYHYYAADPFHENAPPEKSKGYLKSVGQSMIRVYNDFDDEAVWVTQSWSLRKHIVKDLPKGKVLILDIDGEKFKKNKFFWGHDFVLGTLHNFGGRMVLHGDIKALSQNKYLKLAQKKPNLIGTGLFPEAIGHNPMYYDLALEMLTADNRINLEEWIMGYAERRYGYQSQGAYQALSSLKNSVYKKGSDMTDTGCVMLARPTMNATVSAPFAGKLEPAFEPGRLIDSFKMLYAEFDNLEKSDAYRYDLIDLLREVMANLSLNYYKNVQAAYATRDARAFREAANLFLEFINDTDDLLSVRREFDLQTWLDEAQILAESYEEKIMFDKNARALVTVWGPFEEPQIFDYAGKQWSGLLSEFYAARWKMFFDMLELKMADGEEYDAHTPMAYGREAFFGNEFYEDLGRWELSFATTYKEYVPRNKPEFLEIVGKIINKYL